MIHKKNNKNQHANLVIRELKKKEEWAAMYELIKQLNKWMTRKQFDTLLRQMRSNGYRCVGAFESGKLIGLVGFWINYRFWCRKYIDIDNVVVDEKLRSKGVGTKLIAWVEQEGRRNDCEMAMLDCYTTSHAAHRFYFREGYCILGYHFTKDL